MQTKDLILAKVDLPENYPGGWVHLADLKDQTQVLIRPIRPDDAPRLQHGFTHLSPQTIYYRFLESSKALTDELARRLSNLNYIDHMALVAAIAEDGEEHLIGVARYAMVGSEQPGSAEVAIVVRDDYQKRGLGTLLLKRLVDYAREHGVETFTGTVHHSNLTMMNFVWKSGYKYDREMIEPGVILVRVHLTNGVLSPQTESQ